VRSFATHRVEVRAGLELAFWREGVGGRPLVLLHGWPETRRIWARNVDALAAAGFEVVVPDLRGYGDSGLAPDGHYDLAAHARDVQALMADALGHAQFAAAGSDLGGGVAIDLGLRFPGAIEQQVLFNCILPALPGLAPIGPRTRQASDYFVRQGRDADALAAELRSAEERRRYVASFYTSRFWGAVGGFSREEVAWMTEPFGDAEKLRAGFGNYESALGTRALSEQPRMSERVTVPTLALYGPRTMSSTRISRSAAKPSSSGSSAPSWCRAPGTSCNGSAPSSSTGRWWGSCAEASPRCLRSSPMPDKRNPRGRGAPPDGAARGGPGGRRAARSRADAPPAALPGAARDIADGVEDDDDFEDTEDFEIAPLESRFSAEPPSEIAVASRQVARIVEAAEKAAEAMRRGAERRADDRIAEADRAADLRVQAAEDEAADLLAEARDRAADTVEEARKAVAHIHETAERVRGEADAHHREVAARAEAEARLVLQEAEEHSRDVRTSARDEARTILNDAHATAREVVREGEELTGNMRELAGSLVRNAEKLMRDIHSVNGELVARLDAAKPPAVSGGPASLPPPSAPARAPAPAASAPAPAAGRAPAARRATAAAPEAPRSAPEDPGRPAGRGRRQPRGASTPLPAEIADLLQPEETNFEVPEFVKPPRRRRG
jgi:pimeloyl-ACP methyl ester carboxylesterase